MAGTSNTHCSHLIEPTFNVSTLFQNSSTPDVGAAVLDDPDVLYSARTYFHDEYECTSLDCSLGCAADGSNVEQLKSNQFSYFDPTTNTSYYYISALPENYQGNCLVEVFAIPSKKFDEMFKQKQSEKNHNFIITDKEILEIESELELLLGIDFVNDILMGRSWAYRPMKNHFKQQDQQKQNKNNKNSNESTLLSWGSFAVHLLYQLAQIFHRRVYYSIYLPKSDKQHWKRDYFKYGIDVWTNSTRSNMLKSSSTLTTSSSSTNSSSAISISAETSNNICVDRYWNCLSSVDSIHQHINTLQSDTSNDIIKYFIAKKSAQINPLVPTVLTASDLQSISSHPIFHSISSSLLHILCHSRISTLGCFVCNKKNPSLDLCNQILSFSDLHYLVHHFGCLRVGTHLLPLQSCSNGCTFAHVRHSYQKNSSNQIEKQKEEWRNLGVPQREKCAMRKIKNWINAANVRIIIRLSPIHPQQGNLSFQKKDENFKKPSEMEIKRLMLVIYYYWWIEQKKPKSCFTQFTLKTDIRQLEEGSESKKKDSKTNFPLFLLPMLGSAGPPRKLITDILSLLKIFCSQRLDKLSTILSPARTKSSSVAAELVCTTQASNDFPIELNLMKDENCRCVQVPFDWLLQSQVFRTLESDDVKMDTATLIAAIAHDDKDIYMIMMQDDVPNQQQRVTTLSSSSSFFDSSAASFSVSSSSSSPALFPSSSSATGNSNMRYLCPTCRLRTDKFRCKPQSSQLECILHTTPVAASSSSAAMTGMESANVRVFLQFNCWRLKSILKKWNGTKQKVKRNSVSSSQKKL